MTQPSSPEPTSTNRAPINWVLALATLSYVVGILAAYVDTVIIGRP